jgi:hypothetical protein
VAASVFAAFVEGVEAGDPDALRPLLAEAGIVVRLEPAPSPGTPGEEPTFSREQVYYMLAGWLGEDGIAVEESQCDCPGPGDGVDDAHGVLRLAGGHRLFVRLRDHDEQWRVVELRALP